MEDNTNNINNSNSEPQVGLINSSSNFDCLESHIFSLDKRKIKNELLDIIDIFSTIQSKYDSYHASILSKTGSFKDYNNYKESILSKIAMFKKSFNLIVDESRSSNNQISTNILSPEKQSEFFNINKISQKDEGESEEKFLNIKRTTTDHLVLINQTIKKEYHLAHLEENVFKFVRDNYKMVMDRPANKFAKLDQNAVNCSFCGYSSHDEASLKMLGPIYGPISSNNFYVHEKCALYSINIYLNDKSGLLEGVEDTVIAAKNTLCVICNKYGASLRCMLNKCKEKFHFNCAMNKNYYLDNLKYRTFCLKHMGKKLCNVDPLIDNCTICFSKMDPGLLITCEECRKNYHVYCLSPKLKQKPNGSWRCCS